MCKVSANKRKFQGETQCMIKHKNKNSKILFLDQALDSEKEFISRCENESDACSMTQKKPFDFHQKAKNGIKIDTMRKKLACSLFDQIAEAEEEISNARVKQALAMKKLQDAQIELRLSQHYTSESTMMKRLAKKKPQKICEELYYLLREEKRTRDGYSQDPKKFMRENGHYDVSNIQTLPSVTWNRNIENGGFNDSKQFSDPSELISKQMAFEKPDIPQCERTVLKKLESPKDTHRENWLKNMSDLVTFKEEHGHFNVPLVYDKNPKLGNWVKKLRTQYRSILNKFPDNQTSLTEEHIRILHEIGFTWNHREESFFHWYQKLLQYKEKYGNVHVMDDCAEFGGIGNWAKQIRKAHKKMCQHKHNKHALTREKVQMLDELGFQWSISEVKWMRKFEKLVNFRKIFGTCFVSKKYDYHLYNFVNIQRRDYRIRFDKSTTKKGRGISDKRIKLLKEIDFVFEVKRNS